MIYHYLVVRREQEVTKKEQMLQNESNPLLISVLSEMGFP